MGKFDGILIVSDWDGTMCQGTEIPQSNIDAAKYFTAHGGMFTICTGRHSSYINEFKEKICPNTYIISLNGACIIKKESNEILYEGYLDSSVTEIIDKLYLESELFGSLNILIKGKGHALSLSREEYASIRNFLHREKIYKILMISEKEENALRGCEYVNNLNNSSFTAVRSWPFSMEILNPCNTKGEALRRLSLKLGAAKTIAIGDYENDISMLEAADIGYAVMNAPDSIKAKADRITASQPEGALAAVIAELERGL